MWVRSIRLRSKYEYPAVGVSVAYEDTLRNDEAKSLGVCGGVVRVWEYVAFLAT